MRDKHLNLPKSLSVKNYRLYIVMLSILTLCKCGFNQTIEITPRYFVIQVDSPDDKDICYKLYNDDYIGLLGGGLSNLYKKGDTLIAIKKTKKGKIIDKKYYIIPLYNEDTLDPSAGIKGPFDQSELKSELNRRGMEINQFIEIDVGS